MAAEEKSTNRYTSRKVEVDGITLYDSDARFRANFLKKHLKNTVDVLQGRDNVINAEQSMLQTKYNTLLNMQLLKFYTGEKIDL